MGSFTFLQSDKPCIGKNTQCSMDGGGGEQATLRIRISHVCITTNSVYIGFRGKPRILDFSDLGKNMPLVGCLGFVNQCILCCIPICLCSLKVG